MKELIVFVSALLTNGVLGNRDYDELKTILGPSFDRLSIYLSKNEEAKFEGALEMLIEQNIKIKQDIEKLQKKKSKIPKDVIIQKTYYDIQNNSVSIGGSNSGNIITGDNNTISGKSNIIFK